MFRDLRLIRLSGILRAMRTMPLFAGLLLLAACGTDARLRDLELAEYRSTCAAYGHAAASPDMARCVENLDQQARTRRTIRASSSW